MTVCSVSDCGRLSYVRGWCNRHYQRWLKHGDPLTADGRGRYAHRTGPESHLWRGDQVTYSAAHDRVIRLRGRAAEHPCAHCGGTAREWAYDKGDPNERVENSAYSADPDRYKPLCVPCHRLFDNHPWMRNIARQKESDCGRTGNP